MDWKNRRWCSTGAVPVKTTGDQPCLSKIPTSAPNSLEAVLSMLIDRSMSEDGDVAVIPANQIIDALLKVVGFMIAQSPPDSRRDRRILLDGISRYLDRQILGYEQMKREGHYRNISAVRPQDLN